MRTFKKDGVDIKEFKIYMREYRKVSTVYAVQIQEAFCVETEEGIMVADPGDFLCLANTNVGEIWPVNKDIFLNTYEVV